MNKFIVTGNLTKDGQMNKNGNGIELTIANKTGYGEYENTNFFNIILRGKSLENRLKVFKKGAGVLAECQIEVKNKDGKYYTNYSSVNVEIVKFAKNENQESSELDF